MVVNATLSEKFLRSLSLIVDKNCANNVPMFKGPCIVNQHNGVRHAIYSYSLWHSLQLNTTHLKKHFIKHFL